MAEAEAAFRTALQLQPHLPCRMPGWRPCCAASCPTRTSPPWKSGWPTTNSARARAPAAFGLAHALDGRGDYARAADCLRRPTP